MLGDLKPANFVLMKGRLKLIDFGVAMKLQRDEVSACRSLRLGTVFSDPPWTEFLTFFLSLTICPLRLSLHTRLLCLEDPNFSWLSSLTSGKSLFSNHFVDYDSIGHLGVFYTKCISTNLHFQHCRPSKNFNQSLMRRLKSIIPLKPVTMQWPRWSFVSFVTQLREHPYLSCWINHT